MRMQCPVLRVNNPYLSIYGLKGVHSMSDYVLSRAMRRMLKARERVAQRNVWFASVIYNVRLIEAKADQYPFNTLPPECRTMCTDSINVYFNPDVILDMDHEPHIEGMLLHEVIHAAFRHISRRDTRDPKRWNQACDYSINPMIDSIFKLPAGYLNDPKYRDMSSERIYEILQADQEKKQDGKGKGKPDKGDKEGSGRMVEPSEEELEKADQDWQRTVQAATERGEKAGTVHGQLKRLIEELYPAENINWRDLLQDMARNAKSRNSGSWARPNRRYLGHGITMPGEVNDNVYRLIVCLDTSGSITDEQIKAMKSETMSLLDQQIVTHVTMISTDTRVCNVSDVDSSEDVQNFNLGHHGGGTDFRAAMAYVAQVPDAVGCVFLTDMMTSSFGDNPGIPTVWVNWIKGSTAKAPYGVTVDY